MGKRAWRSYHSVMLFVSPKRQILVIPAQAGTQAGIQAALQASAENLDSRLRGNDDGLANSVVNMRRKRLTE